MKPLVPDPDPAVRRVQLAIRKAGGDGNDIVIEEHVDGTVSVHTTGDDGSNRHRAASLEESSAKVVADIERHRDELRRTNREARDMRRRDTRPTKPKGRP